MTLLEAVHSEAGTFHPFAAACTSIIRAAAPPLRTYSFDCRTPRLPPVENSPQARLRATLWPGAGYSISTLLQSQSSSSAMSCARPVIVPWPISARTARIRVVLSGRIATQTVISGEPSAARTTAGPKGGRRRPSARPPPRAALPMRKVRRSIFGLNVMFAPSGLGGHVDRLAHLLEGAAAAPSSRCARRSTWPPRPEGANMTFNPKIDRRTFLIGSAALGGGLALGLRLPPFGPAVVRAADGSPEITVWVAIRPDNTTLIRAVRAEMGQGTITGLAQLIAEELDCDWSKVEIEYPAPGQSVARKRAWGEFSTGGSRGVRQSNEYVRKGGAAARMMLVQAAANEWKVPASECTASASVITHKPSGRKTTYGKVAEAAARLEQPKDVPLKDPKTWKIAGKPLKRLDTATKVNGRMIYGVDLKLPGMLNAAVKDCPVFGGKVKSFDAARVSGMKGVRKVLQVGDSGVAVIADTWWQAKTALEQLPIVWDEGENAKVSSSTIAEVLKAGLDAEQAFVGNQAGGDVKAALAGAAKRIEAVYAYPFQNHACMEPMNATVRWTPERCEMWGPTQNGEGAFAQVLEASGLP